MTPDQLRLLAELHDRQILGLADEPGYWSAQIRDTSGGGSPKDARWRAAGLWRKTYRWGIAMTAAGDYMSERGIRAPEHVATITWRQFCDWAAALPEDRRAIARRARMSIHTADEAAAVAALFTPVVAQVEEMTLW